METAVLNQQAAIFTSGFHQVDARCTNQLGDKGGRWSVINILRGANLDDVPMILNSNTISHSQRLDLVMSHEECCTALCFLQVLQLHS